MWSSSLESLEGGKVESLMFVSKPIDWVPGNSVDSSACSVKVVGRRTSLPNAARSDDVTCGVVRPSIYSSDVGIAVWTGGPILRKAGCQPARHCGRQPIVSAVACEDPAVVAFECSREFSVLFRRLPEP